MEEKVILEEFSEALSPEDEALLKKMFDAGLHWGRKRSLTHPKMRPFIFSSRGELEIIDLTRTIEALHEAEKVIREVVMQNGTILLIGTQPAAKTIVREVADALGFPYVVTRWLGGTLTNFKTFQTRIKYLKELEAKIQSPEFANYTKKERLDFQKEYEELKEKFEGLVTMGDLPQLLFIIGISRHRISVEEARKRGIRMIAVTNTNDDPTLVDCAIPANDNSSTSAEFLLSFFKENVEEGRKRAARAREETETLPEPLPQTP